MQTWRHSLTYVLALLHLGQQKPRGHKAKVYFLSLSFILLGNHWMIFSPSEIIQWMVARIAFFFFRSTTAQSFTAYIC